MPERVPVEPGGGLPYESESTERISAWLLVRTIQASPGGNRLSLEMVAWLGVKFGDCYLVPSEGLDEAAVAWQVKRICEKERGQKIMPDPEVLQPHSLQFYSTPTLMPEFYVSRNPPLKGWPKRDSPEALLKAANDAHDRLRKLVRVNDRLRQDQGQLITLIKNERRWRKVLMAAIGVLAAPLIAELWHLVVSGWAAH